MNVLKASYHILTPTDDASVLKAMRHIERICRVCYKSEGYMTEDGISAKKLISKLISNHHEAMIEHFVISVLFTVDRGITHELVRHRLASFAQESTRYCNYSKDKFDKNVTFINLEHGIDVENKMTEEQKIKVLEIWSKSMKNAEQAYFEMLEAGASPQIARSVLPQSTKSDIVITANLREWRTIFKLRTDSPAHPQMREIMIPLLDEFKQFLPEIFGDL